MIRLAPRAARQLARLLDYYADRGREAAIANLEAAIERAAERYQLGRGAFFPAPRPYPTLIRAGYSWTKEGPYWMAFSREQDIAYLRAIFHETADIPRRL